MTETVHASTVATGGRAVLLSGPSGSGKSDLALRLIDRGFTLVSDDQTVVMREGDRLIASAPPTIAGKLEVRGLGIVEMETLTDVPIALCNYAVVLAQRAFPNDFDFSSISRKLALGFDSPGVNALPEFV